MSKPEDIPQDVWDKASDEALKYVDWLRPSNPDAEHVLAVSFASAIMAATAAEREACIALVEAEISSVRERMSRPVSYRILVDQAWGMCADTAAIVRDAIRSRTQSLPPINAEDETKALANTQNPAH